MVVDTLNPSTATATSGRGKAKEILADSATINALRDGTKNVQMSVSVHPRLNAHIIERLAQDSSNLEGEDGKVSIKRTAYANALRGALADQFGYEYKNHGELYFASKRGNAGLVSVFKTSVQSMFELARSIGQMANMTDDQIKSLAFAKAKTTVTSHPQLAGVEITDELLEALWNGGDIDIDDDDGEDDDDEPTTPENAPVAPVTLG